MGTKNDNYCSQCPQKADCKAVYEKLGQSSSPNVAAKVLWAFLVPIGVFVIALVGLDRWLPAFAFEKARTLTVFAGGVVLTLAAVWLGNIIARRLKRTL